MLHEIIVPELAESTVEATVASWLKKDGEAVSKGDVIIELDQKRSGELISYFFHQVKQSLHAQVDNDVPEAEDQLDGIEILSHLFDQLMLELDSHRKNLAQKNTPE